MHRTATNLRSVLTALGGQDFLLKEGLHLKTLNPFIIHSCEFVSIRGSKDQPSQDFQRLNATSPDVTRALLNAAEFMGCRRPSITVQRSGQAAAPRHPPEDHAD